MRGTLVAWIVATTVLLAAPLAADTATLYPTANATTGTVTNPTNAYANDDAGALVSANSSSLTLFGFQSTDLGTITNVTVWVRYLTTAAPGDDTYRFDAATDGTNFSQSIVGTGTAHQASYVNVSLSLGTLTWTQVGTLAVQCLTEKIKGSDGYSVDWDAAWIVVTYTPVATTTVGNGTDPGAASLCPGGTATMVDALTLSTNTGTDTATALQVNFGAGTNVGIGLVEITNDAGTVVYGSATNPSDPQSITLSGFPGITTSAVQYKVRVTPKSHAAMPGVPGASYAVTAVVDNLTSANTKTYSDSTSATVTVDNLSPGDATWGTITPGDTEVALAWTNPGDGDFSQVVILRSTATIGDAPTEGATYTAGNTVGASTVRYVGSGTTFTDTGLTNGTNYYYKVFSRDSCVNYAAGVQTGPHQPLAKTTTVGNGTNPSNATVAPGAVATPLDTFTLQTSTGTDTVTAATVTLASGTWAGLSRVGIWSGAACTGTEYGFATDPATDAVAVTLGTSITATTTLTSYYVCVTPKTHANMPVPPGSTYAVTGTVTAVTSANAKVYSDTASATVTVDNLSPGNATWGTITPGDTQVVLNWTNPGDADFSQVVILRNTAAVADAPVEGATYSQGNTIGASTVRYVGNLATFTDTGLTNGTDYWYRVFAKDTNGNYSATGAGTGPHRPIAGQTTTVGNGTDPGPASLCPGGAATMVDAFTLSTNTGTDTATALQVNFAAGTNAGVGLVEITNDAGTTVYGSAANPSDPQSITLTGFPGITTSATQYKVRVTPKSHAAMPAVPGASYAVTAVVDNLTSTNPKTYSDSTSATVTVDNASPANATWGAIAPGNGQVVLNWTNPADADFSQVIVLRNTAPVGDAPTEGATYTAGNTVGTSSVVYAGSLQTFTDSAVVNGTAYYYKVFSRDACLNYSAGVQTGPHTPSLAGTTTVGNGTNPGTTSLCPGGAATMLDAFTLQTNTGTDTVTAIQVQLAAGTAAGLALVEVTNDGGGTVYGSVANPASDLVAVSLGTSITATTTLVQYKVRVTPRTHAAMPAAPGASYAVTGTVTGLTSTYTKVYGDTASATVTVDNLSPANVSWGAITPGDGQIILNWTNPGADFSQVVILRSTAWITDAPAEGATYAAGNSIGSSTVVYAGSLQTFTNTGLTNDEVYYYKAFARDACLNYAAGAQTGPHRPALNGVTVGTASALASSCRQIIVSAPFTGDADGDGSVKVEYNTSDSWPGTTSCATVSGSSPRTCLVNVPNPATSYFLRVSFTDPDGVSGTNPRVLGPVVVDACAGNSTAPTILFLSPARGATVGGTDRFKVQVWDADGVTAGNVLWGLDGASPASPVTLNATYDCNIGTQTGCGVFEFDVNTTGLTTGPHHVTVKATDSATPGTPSVGYASLPFSVMNSGGVPRGSGTLLRRTMGSQLCVDCHNLPTHSSQGTSGKYGSWAIDCVTCHTPHKTRNIYLVNESVETPSSGRKTVTFQVDDRAGGSNPVNSYLGASMAVYDDGICEACHTRTSYYRNDTSGANNHNHNQSARCVDCHQHGKAFAGAGCNGCHKAPPAVGRHGRHDEVWDSTEGNTASSYTDTASHGTATQYGFACSKCHTGTHVNDTHAGTPADPYRVEVGFDSTAAPANPGGAYAQTYPGTLDADTPSGATWSWSDGTCSNTYCHSNAAPLGGTNSFKSVTWNQAAALTCTSCHDTAGAATTLSQAHRRHTDAAGYGYGCVRCHTATVSGNATVSDKRNHVNGLRNVDFDATAPNNSGGTYAQGPGYTCSNTYCHSNGQDRVAPFTSGPSIAWGATAAADCSSCHGGNATAAVKMGPSNDHAAHMDQAAYLGSNLACGRCHAATVSTANDRAVTTIASHVNAVADVSMPDGGTYGGPATKTCTNVYCHSNGTETPDFVNTNLDWDAGFAKANDCRQCHGTEAGSVAGAPWYVNNAASNDTRNSHQKHVGSAADCVDCHAGTVTAAGALVAGGGLHLDKAVQVSGAGIGSYTDATETCSNIACHGGNSKQWGGTPLVCVDCHGGATDVNNWNVADGILSKVSTGTEWTTYGHGSAAVGFAGANVCLYCHDDNVLHATATNPFRLRGAANASGVTGAYDATSATNGNAVCINCHDFDAGTRYGVDPDGAAGGYTLKKAASSFVDAWHHGSRHATLRDGGKRCWDCHDAHGDGTNIFMIGSDTLRDGADDYGLTGTRSTTSAVFTSSAAGGYAKATTPFTGICQVCHTATNYYRADGTIQTHNTGSDCITCHAHQQPPGNAFKGAGSCRDCHSARTGAIPRARIIGGAAGSEGDDFLRPSRHVSDGTTTSVVTDFDCILCHAEGDVTSSGTDIKTVGANHGADGGTTTVDLRNVDSSGGTGIQAAWPGKRLASFTATTVQRDAMDSFCMGCHDANGASNVTVNATNNGMVTSTTGAAARRLTPFNTADTIRNSREVGTIATSRTRVINVKDQFNSTNQTGKAWASHHNLNQFTKRYSTRNTTAWPNAAWTTYITKEGQNSQTAGETAGLHCSDCHLNEANAHGTRNTWYMLSDASGADTAFTNSGLSTSTDICSKCHAPTAYGEGGTSTDARTEAHTGKCARVDGAAMASNFGAALGFTSTGTVHPIACLLCHGGLEPGMIHGTNSTYEPYDSSPDGTGVSKRYRFMGTGGSMRWYSPTGAVFPNNTSDALWEGTSSFGCYTVAAADTYGGCTQHNTGRNGFTSNRARPLEY